MNGNKVSTISLIRFSDPVVHYDRRRISDADLLVRDGMISSPQSRSVYAYWVASILKVLQCVGSQNHPSIMTVSKIGDAPTIGGP